MRIRLRGRPDTARVVDEVEWPDAAPLPQVLRMVGWREWTIAPHRQHPFSTELFRLDIGRSSRDGLPVYRFTGWGLPARAPVYSSAVARPLPPQVTPPDLVPPHSGCRPGVLWCRLRHDEAPAPRTPLAPR